MRDETPSSGSVTVTVQTVPVWETPDASCQVLSSETAESFAAVPKRPSARICAGSLPSERAERYGV